VEFHRELMNVCRIIKNPRLWNRGLGGFSLLWVRIAGLGLQTTKTFIVCQQYNSSQNSQPTPTRY
jgi:hypothetical protein